MLNRVSHRIAALALSMVVAPALIGCSGDDNGNGGTGPGASDFVGTWSATTFIVDGTDVVAAGTSVTFIFTETEYSFTVGNDLAGIFCQTGVTSCGENGDLSSTETTLTFDPGSSDEVTINYDVAGSVMTVGGTINGSTLSASFQKQ